MEQLLQNLSSLIAHLSASSSPPHRALPPGVKVPTIETFDGKRAKDVRPWVTRARNILKLSGFNLDTPEAVCFVASFLSGAANSWFESEGDRAPYGEKDNAGFRTFDEFAAALIRHLGDPNPEDKARKALFNLRQTTSVKSYSDEFQRLITYLPNRDADDLRFDFINGLKPKIRELLVGKTADMSWQDVRDLAYRFDDVVMSNRFIPSAPNRLRPLDSRRDDPMDLGSAAVSSAPPRPPTPFRGRSSSRSSTSPRRPLPKLTDVERQKLRDNNGCFRCRKYNAGHFAKDCPGPSPVAARGKSPSKN